MARAWVSSSAPSPSRCPRWPRSAAAARRSRSGATGPVCGGGDTQEQGWSCRSAAAAVAAPPSSPLPSTCLMNSAAVGRIEKSRTLSAHLFGSKSVFLVCCQGCTGL